MLLGNSAHVNAYICFSFNFYKWAYIVHFIANILMIDNIKYLYSEYYLLLLIIMNTNYCYVIYITKKDIF